MRCSPVPTVACLARSTARTAPSTSKAVNRSSTPSPPATAPPAGGTFSPLRAAQRLDSHGYSPTLFRQIVEASGSLKSFAQAARAAHLFAGLDISGRHVGRLAHQIGAELAQRRDEDAVKHRQRQLPPRVVTAPALAVVEVDGGRLFTRAPGCGPGVHQAQPKEDKVGCLLSMQNTPHEQDPQPEPPAAFRDARRVARLVQRLHGGPPLPKAAQGEQPQEQAGTAVAAEQAEAAEPWRGAPKRLVRTCVATMQDSRSFGPMLAAEAQARNFYAAAKGAYLGDGQQYNWTIQRGYFPNFKAINDFIHVICYLYLAGWATGQDEEQRWQRYEGWMRACWQGRVDEVIQETACWQEQLGRPPPGEELDENDPRKVVAEALTYLRNNQGRMDYPSYRQEGLPVTSSLVESLVGEFNARVKGKDKHWNRPDGGEDILQLRAAVLSQDDRLRRFFAQRPGCPYRRRPRPA